MALFKIFKGNSSTLPKNYKDGYCYFTINDGKMYIDTKDSDSTGRILLNAGHADTAANVAWSGVTNKPSYYDAKAIKGITRSGTTFTYTCMDGTTGTFTQQDNNTTYGAATSSAAGLMSAADKAKLDKIAAGATANVGTITGVTAGKGLTGGGTSGAVTLNIGAGTGISVTDDAISLSTSGAAAGTYGPSANVSGSNGATINVPQITVDAYGRVTSVTNKTYTSVNTDTNNKVTQNKTTTSYWRPLLSHMGYGDYNVDPGNQTEGVCYHESIAMQPSSGTLRATAFTGNLSGNASTATKLQTTRTLTIGNKGQTFDGSGNVSWALHDILYNPTTIGVTSSWNITTPGIYAVQAGGSSDPFSGKGNPESANGGLAPYRYGQLIVSRASSFGMAQFYIAHTASSGGVGIKYRSGWNSQYVDKWASILDSGNYNNYAPTKTGGGASGTWGINITGNAATATKATQDGSGNTIASTYLKLSGGTMTGAIKHTASAGVQLIGWGSDTDVNANNVPWYSFSLYDGGSQGSNLCISNYWGIDIRTGNNTNLTHNGRRIVCDGDNFTGNSASATKLQTARTIFGKAFNGTGNVAGKPLVYGSYTSTAANRYANSGIEVRENGLVGNTQSDIGYAPSIGFHWSGRIAASLLFHNDGNFYLRKQDGVTRASLDANLIGNASTATTATQAHMLSNFGNTSVAISQSVWQHNPWGITNPKYVWGQAFKDTTVSSDSGNIAILCGANSTAGGYGAHFYADGGLATLGGIYGSKVYGAVWNDYAEYRSCKEEFKPGQVVYENGDDTLSISNSRLQRGCSIVSDTFGFAIGETDEAKCPIAVSGRVLAYGYEPREEFKKHIGWPVCSGPNGTVSIMTEEEEEKYPSRIIGTISAIPDYEEWGTENIKVDNRIWIKIN